MLTRPAGSDSALVERVKQELLKPRFSIQGGEDIHPDYLIPPLMGLTVKEAEKALQNASETWNKVLPSIADWKRLLQLKR